MKLENDLRSDPIRPLVLRIAIPSMLAQFVSVLYSVVDRMYIGNIAQVGSLALAGAGVCGPIVTMLGSVAFWVGVGGSPLISIRMGEGRQEEARRVLANCFLLLTCLALALTGLAYATRRPALLLFGASPETLPYAMDYYSYYLTGTVFALLSTGMNQFIICQGFAKKGMQSVMLGAVLNIILDPVFIFLLDLGVKGAAIATVLSQCVSAALTVLCLVKSDGMCHLDLRRLHFHMDKFLRIMQVGLPAGMQSVIFNISNVLIQSSVNSFGAVTVAGNTAAANIEGFVYISMNALYQTSISFTSQNLGAKNYHRIDQTLVRCMCIVTLIGLVLGNGAHLLGNHLLHIYSDDLEVISFGMQRLSVISVTYCLCGMMDVLAGTIRGLGYSMLPMIVSLIGACVFRIIWIFTVFRVQHTLFILYASYPISWILTILAHFVCYLIVRKKVFRPQET